MTFFSRVVLAALAGLVCAGAGPRALPARPIVGYLDSWNEMPAGSAESTTLAAIPGYVNVVDLAFARPDLVYSGDLDLAGTGLEYKFSGLVLRDAVALLRARQPGTVVLLSVGGAVYRGWGRLDEATLARLVGDLGLDGVDLDYEPVNPACSMGPDRHIHCWTDVDWSIFVTRLRAVLPRPYVLTASVWSVGAYGEGAWREARPVSRYTGSMLSLLRSPAAAELDLLAINAYDAGPSLDPMEAFRAYRAVWAGPLALGVEVRYAGGTGPFFAAEVAEALAREVARDPKGGMMVYPLLALPEGAGRASGPDGRMLARALCRGMGAPGCAASLP